MLSALDIVLTAFHVVIILFNLTGWIFQKTRRIHLVVMGLTLLSWFGLGLLYGWGYCFLTDWHWDVKHQLGERDLPASFITYAANFLLGNQLDEDVIDTVTLVALLVVLLITMYVNFIRKPNTAVPNQ